MIRSRFLLTAAVVATALASPATGQAAFQATFQVQGGPGPFTIADNYRTVAGTSNAANQFLLDPSASPVNDMLYGQSSFGSSMAVNDGRGAIQFSGSPLSGLNVNINGMSNAPGATSGMLTTNTVSVTNTSGAARTIVFTFSDTGYTAPGVGEAYVQQNLTAGSNGLSAGASALVLTEVLDGGGNVIAMSGSTTSPGAAQAVVNSTTVMGSYGSFNLTSLPYQIRTTVTLTLENGASANFNTSAIVAAPAPAGLVMLAGALPFAGLLRLRRRGQAVPAAAA